VTRSQFLGGLPDLGEALLCVGFITTHPTYQGHGVATALMQHLLALPGYEEYVLRDIKDTNTPALKLYAKLGFTEYERRSVRFARRAGFSTYVSLRLMQTT
jgi:ribosomal protein S18 acetylase RimI-like enzyme